MTKVRVGIDLDGNNWIDWDEGVGPNLIPDALFFNSQVRAASNLTLTYSPERSQVGLMRHRLVTGANYAALVFGSFPVFASDPLPELPALTVVPVAGALGLDGDNPTVTLPTPATEVLGLKGATIFTGAVGITSVTQVPATLAQTAYRGRNDDGDLTTATWAAAENTPFNIDLDTPFRLRFQIMALEYWSDARVILQFSRNGGAWQTMDGTTGLGITVGQGATEEGFTVTPLLSAPAGGVDGWPSQASGAPWSLGDELFSHDWFEFESTLMAYSSLIAAGDTLDVRLAALLPGDEIRPLAEYWNTPTITINGGASTGTIMEAYRFRKDDGDQATATWLAAENTAATIPFGKFRLRVQILNRTGGTLNNAYRLQQRVDGGTWADVPVDSTGYRVTGSDFLNWGDNIVAKLTPPTTGNQNGSVFYEGSAATAAISIFDGDYIELVFGLAVFDWAGAVNGAVVEYRVVEDVTGTPLAHPFTPTYTAGS